MGFPIKISEKVLVDCKRSCAICHKFCGTKIELHHIIQKCNGGKDTYENCIPLCFDCHADMAKADPKHPKGKHYTNDELVAHKNNWYKKCKESKIYNYGNECLTEEDKELFDKIINSFNEKIKYKLANDDVGSIFEFDLFYPLSKLNFYSYDPKNEFNNDVLESLRANLYYNISKFCGFISLNTFPETICNKEYAVSYKWLKINKGNNYVCDVEAISDEINSLADILWKSYIDFYRTGKRIIDCLK